MQQRWGGCLASIESPRVEVALLGKQRSRDLKDDPFLACAMAAHAKYLVAGDQDLFDLGKPFEIEMITPSRLSGLVTRKVDWLTKAVAPNIPEKCVSEPANTARD